MKGELDLGFRPGRVQFAEVQRPAHGFEDRREAFGRTGQRLQLAPHRIPIAQCVFKVSAVRGPGLKFLLIVRPAFGGGSPGGVERIERGADAGVHCLGGGITSGRVEFRRFKLRKEDPVGFGREQGRERDLRAVQGERASVQLAEQIEQVRDDVLPAGERRGGVRERHGQPAQRDQFGQGRRAVKPSRANGLGVRFERFVQRAHQHLGEGAVV